MAGRSVTLKVMKRDPSAPVEAPKTVPDRVIKPLRKRGTRTQAERDALAKEMTGDKIFAEKAEKAKWTDWTEQAEAEPGRTWSYDHLSGLKTYPILQLPDRETHDVYDAAWGLDAGGLAKHLGQDAGANADARTPQSSQPKGTEEARGVQKGFQSYVQSNPKILEDAEFMRELKEVCINLPDKFKTDYRENIIQDYKETSLINMLSSLLVANKTIQDVVHLRPQFDIKTAKAYAE